MACTDSLWRKSAKMIKALFGHRKTQVQYFLAGDSGQNH